ncbi:hypothetical protein P3T43_005906 [Paraburkholderia sp. GAS41]|jgi:hypothetical protein|uniref:hypothetical protein n=1 Tax=Paraburkholderia sp. GAS41 TaxID=3035134 RepID=UPI003D1A7ED1
MNKAILTVVMTGVAAVSLSVSGAAFAGNNGGAGNSHGAATAGMTYLGDPVESPWTTKPAGMKMDQGTTNMSSSSDTSNDQTTQAKTDPQ